jgi:hypothetical protein
VYTCRMERRVQVASDYHCPFCPDHADDVFYGSRLTSQPICEGCAIELHYFCEDRERPDDFLIDAVEEHTGLPWSECRKILLEENLTAWQDLEAEQPEEWVKDTMKHLGWTHEQTVAYVRKQINHYQSLVEEANP